MITVFNPFDWFYKKKYEELKHEHDELWKVVEFYTSENERLEEELKHSKKSEMVFKQYCEYVNNVLEERLNESKSIEVDKHINMKL